MADADRQAQYCLSPWMLMMPASGDESDAKKGCDGRGLNPGLLLTPVQLQMELSQVGGR